LGIGPNPQSPIPNPQSPIPNPQNKEIFEIFLKVLIKIMNKFNLIYVFRNFKYIK